MFMEQLYDPSIKIMWSTTALVLHDFIFSDINFFYVINPRLALDAIFILDSGRLKIVFH